MKSLSFCLRTLIIFAMFVISQSIYAGGIKMAVHGFDSVLFKKLRLKWLLIFLIASLLLDVVFLYIVLVDYPVLAAFGQIHDIVWESIKLFLVNAIFLKGGPIAGYFSLKFNRDRSSVYTSPQKVEYERLTKSRLDGISSFDFDTFTVTSVRSLKVNKNGTVIIEGYIIKRRHDGEKTRHSAHRSIEHDITNRMVIPGYFKGMDGIVKALEDLRIE